MDDDYPNSTDEMGFSSLPVVSSQEDLDRLELEDQAQEVGKLSPREFAKLIGVAPQMVYYYIRTGKIELEYCICGRKVVDVKLATNVFESRKKGIVDIKPD